MRTLTICFALQLNKKESVVFKTLRKMPILPKCCCCAKLETGGYIIGGLGVLVGFLFIIGSIAFDHESNEVEDKELIPFGKSHGYFCHCLIK